MSFQIRVNGRPYGLWETATVRRSIDTNTGTFSFSSTSTRPPSSYPVKAGDAVQIIISNTVKVTGFVDAISVNQTEDTHTVTASGRDNVQDIIDSSVPDSVKALEGPISAIEFVQRVVTALGVNATVEDQTGINAEFSIEDLLNADTGQSAMEFMVSFMRKKQIYLITDGTGGLVLFRPSGTSAVTPLQHIGSATDNVKEYSASWDESELFNRYVVRSQDNFGFSSLADYQGDGVDRNADVVDSKIRASRYLEINSEETLLDQEVIQRANEEANIRRARSTVYTAVVATTRQENGTVWDIGQRVKVNDRFAGISGNFLIREVVYSLDIAGGSTTRITCAPADAYSVRGVQTATDARQAQQGARFDSAASSDSGASDRRQFR